MTVYKKIVIIVGTAIIHYGLSLFVLLIAFGKSSQMMDRGVEPPYMDFFSVLLNIFIFPLITLANIINMHLPSGYGIILWFLNSLCWGVGVYFIVKWFSNYRKTNKVKKK